MGRRLEQPQYQAQIALDYQNPTINPPTSPVIRGLVGNFPLWWEKWGLPARWFYEEFRINDCSDGLKQQVMKRLKL
jgi:hypothetical protein